MIAILTNILQLEAVVDIILLSNDGNLLYSRSPFSPQITRKQVAAWKGLLAYSKKTQTAHFVFSHGQYFVCHTEIGYIVIALGDVSNQKMVKKICLQIQAELVDSAACQKALLQILAEVDDTLKPYVIDELAAFGNRKVAYALLHILGRYKDIQDDIKDRLLFSICQTLGYCSATEAIKPLEIFLKNYCSDKENMDIRVENSARRSLARLRLGQNYSEKISKKIEKREEKSKTADEGNVFKDDGFTTCLTKHDNKGTRRHHNSEEEKRVKKLMAEGSKEEAVAIIMKYIELAAKQKMFDKAEKLRDKIIEIDSMMISEIIQAAEIIEEEKIASIEPEHLATWKALIEILTQDEFSALYHSMHKRQYKNREEIVRRGIFLSQLLFVNSGEVQLFAVIDGREIPLKTIGPGEILEGGTFFEASVWTISARSLGAELFVLPRKEMEKLTEKYPSIESKLIDFNALSLSPANTFERTQKSRRKFTRKSISGRVAITLLEKDSRNRAIRFKGDLFDISQGGVGFCMKASRKKNANMLLGKKIRIVIHKQSKRLSNTIAQQEIAGIVVAIRSHQAVSNEYSIHVKFSKQLTTKQLQDLADAKTNKNAVTLN